MDLSAYRDPEIAKGLIEAIAHHAANVAAREPERTIGIMEVCGTHTMAIAKNGLRDVMPPNVRLTSGPGCPVCVTANIDIDTAIELAKDPTVIVTTFGDMMKVPGSRSSMSREKADGGDVRIVYSPLDALTLAQANPDRHVSFIGVGFETTVPVIASVIERASKMGLENFSVFSAHKTVPAALRALASDPEIKIDGFILPGHVSVIIGTEPYRFLAEEFGIGGAVTGFEPVDVLEGVYAIVKQIDEGRAEIENAYRRAVMPHGNEAAVAAIERVFEPVDAEWRGLGVIPTTGLAIRSEYAQFDTLKRIELNVPEPRDIPGCQCGDVLRGVTLPFECKLFGRACRPEHPIGPCMVSSEGSCAAYYRYTDYGRRE